MNIWYQISLWRWNFGEKKEDEEELERRMALAEKMSEMLQDKNKPDSVCNSNFDFLKCLKVY